MPGTAYDQWPTSPHSRWVQVGNTFGRHLMAAAKEYAFDRISESVPAADREIAQRAALDAIYGMMMLLDGVADSEIDAAHRVEYVLLAHVREITESYDTVEEFELAPDGDGLCIGFHGWVEGDFGKS